LLGLPGLSDGSYGIIATPAGKEHWTSDVDHGLLFVIDVTQNPHKQLGDWTMVRAPTGWQSPGADAYVECIRKLPGYGIKTKMKTQDRLIWRDGTFIKWADATIHILSQSLQRGTLAFDYISINESPHGPAIFRLREHMERLVETCRLGNLPLGYSASEMCEAAIETVRRNPDATSIKISALIPSLEVDVVPQDSTVSVIIAAYDGETDIIAKNKGKFHRARNLKLFIEEEKRNRRNDIMPAQAKIAANYASPMTAKWRARNAGYDEIVLLDEDGFVTEAPTSNIFIVTGNGILKTPPAHKVLHGITRRSILELAAAKGIDVAVEDLVPADLLGAAEVFMTATSAGVLPVESINQQPIGNGSAGDITLSLKSHLAEIEQGQDEKFEHWLTYVNV
jgi:branched-chain amino acid aminotransferase